MKEGSMRFEMAARGSFFATRDRANVLFAELEHEEVGIPREQELVLDFTGVTHISDSFARFFVNRVLLERQAEGRPAHYVGAVAEVEETISWARECGEAPLAAVLPA
jgi:hypothetical protein